MNVDQLRALQAPIKQRYKDDPDAAIVTMTAVGHLGEDLTCRVPTHAGDAVAGLHPAAGGSGLEACSGDMLLQALVACAGVTLRAVATAMGIPIARGTVRAEGDVDFRGTLGVARDAPVGVRALRLAFELETSATEEQLATLLKLTERYCVVLQTIKHPPALTATIHPTPM
jgi:uncharacterized OsmC-like protein